MFKQNVPRVTKLISGRFPGPKWATVAIFAIILGILPCAVSAQTDAEIVAEINRHVQQAWKDNGVQPSPRAEDGEFVRRVSLDTVGRIPELGTLLTFLQDTTPDKRARYVDQLLDHSDYNSARRAVYRQ